MDHYYIHSIQILKEKSLFTIQIRNPSPNKTIISVIKIKNKISRDAFKKIETQYSLCGSERSKIIQSEKRLYVNQNQSQLSTIKHFGDLLWPPVILLWNEEKKRGSAQLRLVLMGHDVRGTRGEGRTRILSIHNRLLSSPIGGDNRDEERFRASGIGEITGKLRLSPIDKKSPSFPLEQRRGTIEHYIHK